MVDILSHYCTMVLWKDLTWLDGLGFRLSLYVLIKTVKISVIKQSRFGKFVLKKKGEKCRVEEDIFQIYTAFLRKNLISFLLNGKIPPVPILPNFYTYLRDIHTECSKQFKWNSYFMCLGRAGRFGRHKNCSKIQIWNLNRLTHIQFNVLGWI